jgi:hypothetical protein
MAIVPILAGNDATLVGEVVSHSGVGCVHLPLPLLSHDEMLALVTGALGTGQWLTQEALRAVVAMSGGLPRFLQFVLETWRTGRDWTAADLWKESLPKFTKSMPTAMTMEMQPKIVALLSLGGLALTPYRAELVRSVGLGKTVAYPVTPPRAYPRGLSRTA